VRVEQVAMPAQRGVVQELGAFEERQAPHIVRSHGIPS
jgi:hypothetical protein